MAKITADTQNKLTDAALAASWSSDQMYREEAKKFTQDFLAKFGIFVGLYNRLNGTSLSVEQALWTTDMVELFQAVSQGIQAAAGNSQPNTIAVASVRQPNSRKKLTGKPKSTKRLSYEQFQVENGTSVAHLIYKHLKAQNTPMSRTEIAKALNLRLSTVCGAVFSMIDAGLVYVSGRTIDQDSNREVEIVSWR